MFVIFIFTEFKHQIYRDSQRLRSIVQFNMSPLLDSIHQTHLRRRGISMVTYSKEEGHIYILCSLGHKKIRHGVVDNSQFYLSRVKQVVFVSSNTQVSKTVLSFSYCTCVSKSFPYYKYSTSVFHEKYVHLLKE